MLEQEAEGERNRLGCSNPAVEVVETHSELGLSELD